MDEVLRSAMRRSGLFCTTQKRIVSGLPSEPILRTGAKISSVGELTDDAYLLSRVLPSRPRELYRFDFHNEWNNLGYGRISQAPAEFSLSSLVDPKTIFSLQDLYSSSGHLVGSTAGVYEHQEGSTLWLSRPSGPCDGYDWLLVERYFSDYKFEELECLPVIKETPWSYDGAVTMRLDCDEAIASAKELLELYCDRGLPLSLAIKTDQPILTDDLEFIKKVIQAGGSVVTHSHKHAPNWGGSAASARSEIFESQKIMRDWGVDGINYDYAVSPFHQNSRSSVQGLRDAGIKAFVSGIVANDPEYLMARAGQVPYVDNIYSHSQQCMLHGECYHNEGGRLNNYFDAFSLAMESETFFGYLDHPQSSYRYGWSDFEEQVNVHAEFLSFVMSHNIWFASLERALDFLSCKQESTVWVEGEELRFRRAKDARFVGLPDFCIRWKGQDWKASDWEVE